jgi:hypothetical protein
VRRGEGGRGRRSRGEPSLFYEGGEHGKRGEPLGVGAGSRVNFTVQVVVRGANAAPFGAAVAVPVDLLGEELGNVVRVFFVLARMEIEALSFSFLAFEAPVEGGLELGSVEQAQLKASGDGLRGAGELVDDGDLDAL